MKQQSEINPMQSPYSKSVCKAYYQILKQSKQLLSTIDHEELRFTLVRKEASNIKAGTVLHEFINPLLYLRLELGLDNKMAIHFGFETVQQVNLSTITAKFVRALIKYTARGITVTNIEDCVHTERFINLCNEFYEYIELRNKHHAFKQIQYKCTTSKRKELLSVA